MKGIVFTEFLNLVETKFGLETVDEIITNSQLDSGGVYTAVGTYNFSEMLELLNHLSKKTKLTKDDLLYAFAEHFFMVIKRDYPKLINSYTNPITMLASIENHIHIEVLKLYPDAELPTFNVTNQTNTSLTLIYTSNRALHAFALGLMHQTFKHFNTKANISEDHLTKDGAKVKFTISLTHE